MNHTKAVFWTTVTHCVVGGLYYHLANIRTAKTYGYAMLWRFGGTFCLRREPRFPCVPQFATTHACNPIALLANDRILHMVMLVLYHGHRAFREPHALLYASLPAIARPTYVCVPAPVYVAPATHSLVDRANEVRACQTDYHPRRVNTRPKLRCQVSFAKVASPTRTIPEWNCLSTPKSHSHNTCFARCTTRQPLPRLALANMTRAAQRHRNVTRQERLRVLRTTCIVYCWRDSKHNTVSVLVCASVVPARSLMALM